MTPVARWVIVEILARVWKKVWYDKSTPPKRRRVWRGLPLLMLLPLLAGCPSAWNGLSRQEIVNLCESLAPCEECPPVVVSPPTPVPTPPAPVPTPPVEPPPSPVEPTPAPGLDLSQVSWLHRSPAAFPVTAKIKAWGTNGVDHWVEYSHPKDWKVDGGRVVGNLWVIPKLNGRWYGATFEWVLDQKLTDPPGQFKRALEYNDPKRPFIQTKRSPIDKWEPQRGEEFYVLLSTITRANVPADWPVGRSEAYKARW